MGYLRKGKWIRDEKFVSGRGECVCEAIGAPSMLRLIRNAVALARILPTLESGRDKGSDANWSFSLCSRVHKLIQS